MFRFRSGRSSEPQARREAHAGRQLAHLGLLQGFTFLDGFLPAAATSTVDADTLWPQVIARVRKERPLISEWIEAGKLLEITNGAAVLGFPPDAGLARDSCERANNRTFLEKLLSELAGEPLKLKTETKAGLAVERLAREETKPEPQADPMELFKNDPLIQKALADFKAEILPA